MPKSKRNKTVDLSKTKKHGLEGKKELYQKIQSNVENYAYVFVFAVNDMRNSKMKNVREQWKQSRFCIGKNRVMAMALGRTPEEEYRPNLHKIGQMLMGERGLFFTNQPIEEVTNWFESYSEGDFARSGNVATQDVILPEGPLSQFPHNLESYLRQLGLPTTLKKGVIHLIKEHVVCTEGDRLSPETARILKLLGYEMAEFRIKIMSVWCQDGSFINFNSASFNSESKENVANDQKSFMRDSFELAKDCLLLGDNNNEMETEVGTEDKNKISDNTEKEIESEELETEKRSKHSKPQLDEGKKSSREAKENARSDEISEDKISPNLQEEEPENPKLNSTEKEDKAKLKNKKKQTNDKKLESTESEEKDSEKVENEEKESGFTIELEVEDVEMDEVDVLESEVKKLKNELAVKKPKKETKKSVNKPAVEKTEQESGEDVEVIDEKVSSKNEHVQVIDEKISSKNELSDRATMLKLTEKKLEESAEKPKKFSPKMTRARAAAANIKVNEPKSLETKKNARKRKM